MTTKYALTLSFMAGPKSVFSYTISSDSAFPLPARGEKFVLHHSGTSGALTEYAGNIRSSDVEISSNDANGFSMVNQIVVVEQTVATKK
jgi:hypothetical protein